MSAFLTEKGTPPPGWHDLVESPQAISGIASERQRAPG
jgi:hypothetical protein